MSEAKDRYFLLEVQHCPMELEVSDDISYFKECMEKCFGDHKMVKCEHVKVSDKTLFCEMIIKATQSAKSEFLPTGTKIVMEFDRGLL